MDNYTGDPSSSLHRNLSLILVESYKSNMIVWVMEVLVFCFEIGIIFDQHILRLILQTKTRKYLDNWEITNILSSEIFSEFGFLFSHPSRLLASACICIFILGAAIFRITRSRPTGSSQEYTKSFSAVNLASKDKPLFPDDIFWFFLRYGIYLAPYFARIYLLFFWAGISCTPVIKQVAWKGDSSILPTSNDQLSMVLSIFNNVIVYESSLFSGDQCFSGNQIILTLCWIVVGLQLAFFLMMHHRATDFIPVPKVILGKSAQWIEWIDFGVFGGLYLLKAVTTKFLEESVAPVIPWFYLVVQIAFYFLQLLYKPYYCTNMLNWRIIKHLALASLAAWILVLQHASVKGTLPMTQTLLKFEFFWLVTISLFVAFVARLSLQRIKLSELLGRLGKQVTNSKYSTISLSDVRLLVYVFCELRDAVATGRPGAFSTKEMSRIKFMFSQLFLAHRSACTDKLCLCHSREIYLKAIKMHRLDAKLPPDLKWVTEVIFTCQFVLDKKLASLGGDSLELKSNKEFTAFFILWSVFSVENYGNTLAILSILSKLLRHDLQAVKSKRSQPSFFGGLCSASWRTEVLKSFLKLVIETQSKYLDSVPWSTAFVSQSCKDSDTTKNQVRWVTDQFVTVNEYLNDLFITGELINEAISWKIDFLATINHQKKTKVLTCSDNYLDNCTRVESMFCKLNLPNQMVYFKTALLKLSYLLKVKEDYLEGKQLLARTAQSRVSSNVLSSLEQSEISRSVVLTIGAESENFHEIVGCTSNLRDWGYSLPELVGTDLNSILPGVVSEFHKPMLQKAFKETGWNSQILETRVPLAQGVISSTGEYIPTVIYIKLNCLLTFGFQIFGFCVPRLDTAPVELVLDSMGVIRHMTKSAKTIFKEGRSFLEHSRVLTGLLQKLTAKEYRQMRLSDRELAETQEVAVSSANKPTNVWSPERQSQSSLETELWMPMGVVAEENLYKGAVNRVRLLVRATSNYKSKSLFYNFLFTIDPDCPSLKDEEIDWQETLSNEMFEEEREESSATESDKKSHTSYDTPQDSDHSLPEEISVPDKKQQGQSPKSSKKGGALINKPPGLNIAHKLIGAKSVISDTNIPREMAEAVTQALDPHALVAYLSKLPETQGLDSPRAPSEIFARLHLKSSRDVELLARVLSSGLSTSRRFAKQSELATSLLNLTKVQTGIRGPGVSGVGARRNGILHTKTITNKLPGSSKFQSRDLSSKTNVIFDLPPKTKVLNKNLPPRKASISDSGSSDGQDGDLSMDPAGGMRPNAQAASSKILKYEHLSDTIVSFGEEELGLLQYSRFLHHTLNITKGIRILSLLLAVPWVAVAVIAYIYYLRESMFSYRFDSIVTDVLAMDASGYLSWMGINYATYFNMRRMAIEGILPPLLYKDYGYGEETYLEHYKGMVNKDSYFGVLATYERKMWKSYLTSEFREYYDTELKKSSLDNLYSSVKITINAFDKGLQSVETDFFKAMQYISPVYDKIEADLVPLEPWNYTLGQNILEVALQASQHLGDYSEYLVYTNMMNPIMKDFYDSRFVLP